MTHHFSSADLLALGVRHGRSVQIHRTALFFGTDVTLGDRVRIDAFAIISGKVQIGNNCHIAAGARLFGGSSSIVVEDFAGISGNASIYTGTDDYTEGYLTGPTIPDEFKKVRTGAVHLGRHVVIGAGSIVLPNVTLGFGATVGALSLVSRSVGECEVVAGSPAKVVKHRNKERLLRLEAEYLASLAAS